MSIVNLPEVDHILESTRKHKMDKKKKLREYAKSDLCDKLNEKYRTKTYEETHRSSYTFSRIVTWIGHSLSIVIGVYLGYQISSFVFRSYDYELLQGITLCNILSIVAALAFISLLEWKKNEKGHYLFEKSFIQSDRPKQNRRPVRWDAIKMVFIFVVSLALNSYGAYKSTEDLYGDSPEDQPVFVDIAAKTAHLEKIVAHWEGQIANAENAQQQLADKGEDRLYKVDVYRIPAMNDSLGKYSSMLTSAIGKWEQHNQIAGNNTAEGNRIRRESHNGERNWYAMLALSVFAFFDCVVIYGIYRQESYLYNCHKEMKAIEKTLQPDDSQTTSDYKPSQKQPNHNVIPVIPVDNTTESVIDDHKEEESEDDKVKVVKNDDGEYVVIDENGKEWCDKEIRRRISQANYRKKNLIGNKDTNQSNIDKYELYKSILKTKTQTP